MLPTFVYQPSEEDELQPAIIDALCGHKYVVCSDKTLNLLILRDGKEPLNLELKVRLQSQRSTIPITPFQWALFRSVGNLSTFVQCTRVLVFDPATNKYALASVLDIRNGLQSNTPSSTSYVKKGVLDSLTWLSPQEAWDALVAWIRDS
ncbi:hypothetical protein FJZ31_29595 [Candidatus Poribacteria bacterium]|nr:hypothetical protein [Candidatus Poribacteria bacterium]